MCLSPAISRLICLTGCELPAARRTATAGAARVSVHPCEDTVMANEQSFDAQKLGLAAARTVRDHWQLFLLEGIALVVLGLLALAAPAFASLAATIFFGWILLISGVIGFIATFRARHAPGFVWSLISAIIGVAAGVLLLAAPLQGTLSLTAIVIAFLLVEGIVTIVYALEHRNGQSGRWGW